MVDSALRAVRTLEQGRSLPELYDLRADPGCTRNLCGSGDARVETAAADLHRALVERLEPSRVPEQHRFSRRLPA